MTKDDDAFCYWGSNTSAAYALEAPLSLVCSQITKWTRRNSVTIIFICFHVFRVQSSQKERGSQIYRRVSHETSKSRRVLVSAFLSNLERFHWYVPNFVYIKYINIYIYIYIYIYTHTPYNVGFVCVCINWKVFWGIQFFVILCLFPLAQLRSPWRCRQHVLPRRRNKVIVLYVATSRETITRLTTTAKASELV